MSDSTMSTCLLDPVLYERRKVETTFHKMEVSPVVSDNRVALISKKILLAREASLTLTGLQMDTYDLCEYEAANLLQQSFPSSR
jgi:hypothetical protein